ncbi:MAG: DUF2189 domain-containing protein [Pseudomonadota bacterium]
MTVTTDRPPAPVLQSLTSSDLSDALRAGFNDFLKAPGFGFFFGGVFSILGILISYLLIVHASSYWVIPIACGFPLIGPFAAVGLYEISRRIEANEPLEWRGILGAVLREGGSQLPSYAFVVMFFYLVWMYLAHLVFALSFGLQPLTNIMSSPDILFTSHGITMLVVGTVVGGVLAGLLFAVSVVSVPMLVDRDIDIVSAMIASFNSVILNQAVMLKWAAILALSIGVAMVPFFLGMLVVFPVLGHASWHLYRRSVAPLNV